MVLISHEGDELSSRSQTSLQHEYWVAAWQATGAKLVYIRWTAAMVLTDDRELDETITQDQIAVAEMG